MELLQLTMKLYNPFLKKKKKPKCNAAYWKQEDVFQCRWHKKIVIFIYNLVLWFLGFKGKNSGEESWELGVAFNLHQQNFLDYVSSLCCSSPIAATQLLTVSPLPPPCLLTSPKCAWLLSFLEYSKIFVASI